MGSSSRLSSSCECEVLAKLDESARAEQSDRANEFFPLAHGEQAST